MNAEEIVRYEEQLRDMAGMAGVTLGKGRAGYADFDRWLAAHDAQKRAEWEAEQGGHVVPCARCGQRKVIASDAINSDIEVCGRCGTEIGLHELAEQGDARRRSPLARGNP